MCQSQDASLSLISVVNVSNTHNHDQPANEFSYLFTDLQLVTSINDKSEPNVSFCLISVDTRGLQQSLTQAALALRSGLVESLNHKWNQTNLESVERSVPCHLSSVGA